jgi:hypothetical protein
VSILLVGNMMGGRSLEGACARTAVAPAKRKVQEK